MALTTWFRTMFSDFKMCFLTFNQNHNISWTSNKAFLLLESTPESSVWFIPLKEQFLPAIMFGTSQGRSFSKQPHQAILSPDAQCVCFVCLFLPAVVVMLPWPSWLMTQSLQPVLMLHRPQHKWSHSSHFMSSDKWVLSLSLSLQVWHVIVWQNCKSKPFI